MGTELKLACRRIVGLGALRPFRLPARPKTAEVALRLNSIEGDVQRRGRVDFDAIAREIAATITSGHSLTRKQFRDATWCLWDTSPSLARDDAALTVLLRGWEGYEKPRIFRSLAAAFLKTYGTGQHAREHVAGVLQALAKKWGGNWGELHQRYAIFDLERGPREIAREVLRSDRSPVEILREFGLGDIVAQGGLSEAVVGALLGQLAESHDHERRLTQVQRFSLGPDGKVLFSAHKFAVIDALIRPFLGKPATVALQDRFLPVIVKAFGDPRLRPDNWFSLPHRDIVVGWLTRQSLRQFLDVVDATTVDWSAKRMWRYRRAFWEGVYEFYRRQDIAVEAWVAFGPDGARKAQQVFKDATFAILEPERKQVLPDHAVLLFRIAGCVVADWNHDGKCNIWSNADARSAPKLFKKSMKYGSDEIRIEGRAGNIDTKDLFSIMHMSPETYNWQNKVAQRLYQLTGLRVPNSAFQVR